MMNLKEKIGSKRIESATTTAAGGRIHYRTNPNDETEAKPPVVLLHGFVLSSTFMIPLAHELAPHCRVVAPDLPGYGESFRPSRIGRPSEMADVLAEILDSLGIRKASLVGNSYGCQTLVEFGAKHPERTERIVLVGPTTDPRHRSLPGQMSRLMMTSRYEDRTLGKLSRKEYRKAGLRTILASTQNCFEHPVEKTLPRVRAPVLVVRGTEDSVVNERWARETVNLLPDATLRELPGGGHALNYSHPLELARIIRPFLRI